MEALKPNDFGLFDVHGSALTWCQERFKPQESFKPYPPGEEDEAAEDQEDGLVVNSTDSRSLRGGAFYSDPLNVRSATRDGNGPADRNGAFGFRPVRTIVP